MRDFIYNAFKSLDEFEKEENKTKKKLNESIESNNLSFDQTVKDSYEHLAYDLGEDPVYLNDIVDDILNNYKDYNTKYDTAEDFNKFYDEVAISLNKQNLDYIGDLEESKKKKDKITYVGNPDAETAFFNNAMGASEGAGLAESAEGEKLEERIPTDLKKAYKRADGINNTDTSAIQKGLFSRRGAKVDFEKANYREVDKDEAARIAKDKNELPKLRFIIKDNYGNTEGVILYNNQGRPISRVDSWVHQYENRNGKIYSDSRYWPIKHVIDVADTIYYTDEDDYKISDTWNSNPNYDSSVADNYDMWKYSGYGDYVRNIDSQGEYSAIYDDPIANKRYKNRLVIKDTGSHSRGNDDYYLRNYKSYYNSYLANKRRLESDPDNEEIKARMASDLRNAQYYYRDSKQRRKTKADVNSGYLKYLCKLGMIKYSAYKNYIDRAKDKIESIKNDRWINSYSEKRRQIKDLEEEINRINDRINELQNSLTRYQLQIDAVKDSVTEEEKEEYKEKITAKIEEVASKYYKFKDELDKMLGKKSQPVEECVLKEDVEEETLSSYYKIYIEEDNGKEDIIDAQAHNDEDVALEAKELFEDNNYNKVVAIRLDEKEDLIETQKLWDSDNITESLTESKKFNLKDEDAVTDAIAYSDVEDKEDDTLVAIDPNIESKDESAKAEIGDALLECRACKSIRTMKVDDLIQEPDSDVYNKDDACPHCGAKDGYNYVAQLASPDAEEVKELDITEEDKIEEEEPVEAETPVEETEEETVDLELKEESFDTLINKHLTSLYENIASYKTTGIKAEDNNIIIEGILTSDKGKEIGTTFNFTLCEEADKYLLQGNNNKLASDENSFNVRCSLADNALICEDLSCKYVKDIDNQKYLIEGYETINE